MRGVLLLLLCPCAVAVLLHLWLLVKRGGSGDFGRERPQASAEVLVGVLSARHHRLLRNAIRDTWLGYLRRHSHFQHRVMVKFIVGRYGCEFPEEDREDPYSCTLLNLTHTDDNEEVELLSLPDASLLLHSELKSVSLDFKVLHPLVITHLGVFPDGPDLQLHRNVTVRLFQLDQEEAVVTAHFSAVSSGKTMNGVWYKPVEQFILPRGFEGSLVWESLDAAGLTMANISRLHLNTGGGVLRLSAMDEGVLPHRSARGFPGLAGSFTFSLYDVESMLQMLRGRRQRQELHKVRIQQEEAELEEESRLHNDMVLVDIVDTYRSVPSKLLQFYKWAVGKADFSFLLKTDDDCYIDVDAVLMRIEQKGLKQNNLWWGNFRQNWAVERVGKWQELEYASPAYPAFACGSGYVISYDLVQWLADNAHRLKAYQGEDVSMGIWMAAVGPKKYQDSAWLCEKDCYQDMLSSPQHSADDLRWLWAQRQSCGDPCG